MLDVLRARLLQGHRTIAYPDGPAPSLPERFAGRPCIDTSRCSMSCVRACVSSCPTGAIAPAGENGGALLEIDTGKCIFCRACAVACPHMSISFTGGYAMAATKRKDLIVGGGSGREPIVSSKKVKTLFGKSLKLRQVSAGGCNACEADTNVLNTVGWDLGRFGIQFVASPRHADGLLVTGPVSRNMKDALLKTYEAVASPKIVIAVGSCAISGGPYCGHAETCSGVDSVLPVDLFIPGCPPHPLTILDGLLRFIGRI